MLRSGPPRSRAVTGRHADPAKGLDGRGAPADLATGGAPRVVRLDPDFPGRRQWEEAARARAAARRRIVTAALAVLGVLAVTGAVVASTDSRALGGPAARPGAGPGTGTATGAAPGAGLSPAPVPTRTGGAAAPRRPDLLAPALGTVRLAPLDADDGSSYRVQVEPTDGDQVAISVRLWAPRGLTEVRGLLVRSPTGAAALERDLPSDGPARAEAARRHLAVVEVVAGRGSAGTGTGSPAAERRTGLAVVTALRGIAATSGLAGVATAPLVVDVTGGRDLPARALLAAAPDRIALVTSTGGTLPAPQGAALDVPWLVLRDAGTPGERAVRADLATARAQDAPWTLALRRGAGLGTAAGARAGRVLVTAWWEAVLPVRLPAEPEDGVLPVDTAGGLFGDPSTGRAASTGGAWLPDERSARLWEVFSTSS